MRHDASPPWVCRTADSALAKTMPPPMPEPLTPMAAPRREGRTTEPARPGAGTQMKAPPKPVSASPTARATALSACHRTSSPELLPSSPPRIMAAGSARRDSALTATAPSR